MTRQDTKNNQGDANANVKDDQVVVKSGRTEGNRRGQMSTRENADFKWKQDETVIGALEIPKLPNLDIHAPAYMEKPVPTCKAEFTQALQIWKAVKGKQSFMQACDSIPPVTSCCGLIYNSDDTVKQLVPLLNKGWADKMNQKPELIEAGLTVSTFVWSWTNVMGEAETVILLIRFHMEQNSRHLKDVPEETAK